jgi:DUF2892 family protein
MSRDRVASSSFGQFMTSPAGRITRGLIGAVLIGAGVVLGGAGGWALGAFGVVLVAAGLFDFCLVTGLVDNVWSGRQVRALGRHTRAARPV